MSDENKNDSAVVDLLIQLEENEESLQNLRFQKSMQQLEDLSQIKKVKKTNTVRIQKSKEKQNISFRNWYRLSAFNRETHQPKADIRGTLLLGCVVAESNQRILPASEIAAPTNTTLMGKRG